MIDNNYVHMAEIMKAANMAGDFNSFNDNNFENISMVLNAMSYDNKESVDKRSENDE